MLVINRDGIKTPINIYQDLVSRTLVDKTFLDCSTIDYSNNYMDIATTLGLTDDVTVTISGLESGIKSTFKASDTSQYATYGINTTPITGYYSYSDTVYYLDGDNAKENIRIQCSDVYTASSIVLSTHSNTKKYMLNNIPYCFYINSLLISSQPTKITIYGFNSLSDICVNNTNSQKGGLDLDSTFSYVNLKNSISSTFISPDQLSNFKISEDTITDPSSIFKNALDTFSSSYNFNDYITMYCDGDFNVNTVVANGGKAINYKYLIVVFDDIFLSTQYENSNNGNPYQYIYGSVVNPYIPYKDGILTKYDYNLEQCSHISKNIYHYVSSGNIYNDQNKLGTALFIQPSKYYKPKYIDNIETKYYNEDVLSPDKTKLARIQYTSDGSISKIRNIVLYNIDIQSGSINEINKMPDTSVFDNYSAMNIIGGNSICFIDNSTIGLYLLLAKPVYNYTAAVFTYSFSTNIVNKVDDSINSPLAQGTGPGSIGYTGTLPTIVYNNNILLCTTYYADIYNYNIVTNNKYIQPSPGYYSYKLSTITNSESKALFLLTDIPEGPQALIDDDMYGKRIFVNYYKDAGNSPYIDYISIPFSSRRITHKAGSITPDITSYADGYFISELIQKDSSSNYKLKLGFYKITPNNHMIVNVGYDDLPGNIGDPVLCTLLGVTDTYAYIYSGYDQVIYSYDLNTFTNKTKVTTINYDSNISYYRILNNNSILCSEPISTNTYSGLSIQALGI